MNESLIEMRTDLSSPGKGSNLTPPKISVIVPVYKVEKYLPECIESVLAQTFTDFELILVDDGSPDNSGKICDDYARIDSRIRVFHKNNEGVAAARADGIQNATGEFIMFLDSDDALELENGIKNVYKYLSEDVDIVEGIYLPFGADKKSVTSDRVFSVEEYQEALSLNYVFLGLWGKLYRRRLFSKDIGRIPREVVAYEDALLSLRLSKNAKRILKVNEIVFRKRIRQESRGRAFALDYRYFTMLDEMFLREFEAPSCSRVFFNFRARWLRSLFLMGKSIDSNGAWVREFVCWASRYSLDGRDVILIWALKFPVIARLVSGCAQIKTYFRFRNRYK